MTIVAYGYGIAPGGTGGGTFIDVGAVVLDEEDLAVTLLPLDGIVDLPDDFVVSLDDTQVSASLSETDQVARLDETQLDIDRTCD